MDNQTTKLFLLCYISSDNKEENMVIRANNKTEALEIASEYDERDNNYIRSRAWVNGGPVTCQELLQSGGCWVITADNSMDDLRAKLDNESIEPL